MIGRILVKVSCICSKSDGEATVNGVYWKRFGHLTSNWWGVKGSTARISTCQLFKWWFTSVNAVDQLSSRVDSLHLLLVLNRLTLLVGSLSGDCSIVVFVIVGLSPSLGALELKRTHFSALITSQSLDCSRVPINLVLLIRKTASHRMTSV